MLTRRFLASVGLVALLVAGCDDESEQIRAYRAPKDPPSAPAPTAAPRVSPPRTPERTLEWDVPDGWRREPNPNRMRFATLSAGTGDHRIEVSVSQLGGGAGGVNANIQRWRGQLGLEPAPENKVLDHVEEIKARGARGLFVDITGPTGKDAKAVPQRMLAAIFPAGGRTWFVKTTAAEPVIAQHRNAFLALCRSVRFTGSAAPTTRSAATAAKGSDAAPQPGGPTWDLPTGWVQEAKPRSMSMASFRISDGEQEAVLTITPLAGSPRLVRNISRWRRQVGLAPLESLDKQPPRKIQVAGREGHYVDLTGTSERILGVIAPRNDTTWFYKLKGPIPLLTQQKGAFEAFIRSIRFGGGARE